MAAKKGTKTATKGTKKTKKTGEKKVKKSKVQVEEKVTKETPVVVEEKVEKEPSVVEEVKDQVELRQEDALKVQLDTLLSNLGGIITTVKSLQAEVKTIQKAYTKVVKDNDKARNKNKKKNRSPSGFAKPSGLSDEMTTFLGLEKGVEIARNEVTKLVNKYIVENSLREESDKRYISPDKKLTKLLNYDKSVEKLSYFNLQKYLKHHFVKV